MMKKHYLVKLSAPLLALSLVAACGTTNDRNDDQNPADNEAPLEEDNGNLNENEPGTDNNPNDEMDRDNDQNEDIPNDDLNKDRDNE